MNPSITYLIFTHNEGKEYLEPLFRTLTHHTGFMTNSAVIVVDDHSTNQETLDCLSASDFRVEKHALNNNFAEHKNYGNSLCSSDWIVQLDGDELVTHQWIQTWNNVILDAHASEIDLLWVPRINYIKGLTKEAARKWGWRVQQENIINFPDFQGRIYRNRQDVQWVGRLHERINVSRERCFVPMIPKEKVGNICIWHVKTLERQESQNTFYNNTFSVDENRGVVS
jgi:glycosyltransferase involved in cell wall biosynthesis